MKDALKILDKSGIKPGQSSISQSRVMEIFNSYDPMKAHTSYTSINGSLYVSEGHHTLIANVMKYGRICSGVNMGGIVSDPAILVGVTWSTLKILPWDWTKKWIQVNPVSLFCYFMFTDIISVEIQSSADANL